MFAYFLLGRERRQSYTVHERPEAATDRVDRAEALEFVKDGFVIGAFLLPLVWLAMHRIWLGVLGYVAAVAALFVISSLLGLPPAVPGLALLVLHLIIGNEADEISRGHLATQGWTMVGQVTGTGPLDCERRFFDSWLPLVPMTTPVGPQPVSQVPAAPAPANVPRAGGILGNVFAPLRRKDRA